MTPPKAQPALLGGAFLGVLSALPFINMANCCCLWVIGGGMVAAYVMQANHPEPITPGDGAVVGLLAGIIGAFVWMIVSIPIDLALGPMQERLLRRVIENAGDVPDELRRFIDNMRYGVGSALRLFVGLMFMLVGGAIFSTLGGLLGAVLFKRQRAGLNTPQLPFPER